MSVGRRRELIKPEHLSLSITRQCTLVSISRSSYYGPAKGEPAANLEVMRRIDEQFLETPWYGSRQMTRHLRRHGHEVNRKYRWTGAAGGWTTSSSSGCGDR